ncbi:hypothetical protein HAP47_0016630 [Bradyrhizobium sp. 41S5]|uniref:hypothetical protein n=1 Tax=Bradyrhizobium sp. 41S5 TaxID=1404443 RepID=UPI001595EAA3|nr:hypothetical protein [Bradyrhizobium sp. 41S5]UFX48194.1 hypothetical protein HAP47_0016630 [Bradyrhizobium sp. 41S5]
MNAQFFVYILASGRNGTQYVGVTKPLGGVTEAEFAKLFDAEAQATRKAGERPATAFDHVDLRKAHQLTRGVLEAWPEKLAREAFCFL